MTSEHPTSSGTAAPISSWAAIAAEQIDLTFVPRQHRRRLSLTTRLALTAYNRCNPELDQLRTVFASRYGEYQRTFGILQDIAGGHATSPAAFSVSVHNTPGGITGIVTGNTRGSSSVAAGAASLEAGFIEAALLFHELEGSEDVVLVYVDERLPDGYSNFAGTEQEAFAVALRLASTGSRDLTLHWSLANPGGPEPVGLVDTGVQLCGLLTAGQGECTLATGRMAWGWRVAAR